MNLGSASRRIIDTGKDTQFSDAWLLLGIVLTLIGAATRNPFFTTAAAFLFVIAGFAWLYARIAIENLVYARRFSETRAFLGETVTLELSLANRKFTPVSWIIGRDIFPDELAINEHQIAPNPSNNLAEFTTFWMLGPRQRLTRRFEIQCTTRGFHRFGPVTLHTGDSFGFFTRRQTVADTQFLIVYPRLYAAAELQLPTKNPFGEVHVPHSLFEDPLRTAGIREWQASDGLRRVHWKATARQQTMLSRIYEPSEETHIQFFLNVATMERHWYGYMPELQERVISVTASLAALADEQRLPFGLSANGVLPASDRPIRLLPGRSPQQLITVLELLAAVTPLATGPIEQLLPIEAPHLPWGATLVVVTGIAHPALLATLLDLAAGGRRIVLVTLAEAPPAQDLPNITVYHLPHLADDLIQMARHV
ncbi:MAG: DUF58 domain-containing protein [Litorilinea sp.]